ncbi:hypothetical protein MGA5115_01081 [Marinomonas gallaica]|uniref:Salt-induced outer membrane protein n=1 Tax=Marinomonas gallaica TaxID=1806667 RepID=A0A1C3JP13_9GAMM|nr:DUF481 domain-containing protein [Marinomonas gallaica]SBT16993.1 hypothetical protein MGA5115_01081 [Marinomonas gallaica]SBT20700.1 hypothetical protein MGA5116_01287 [Marinomonas gallaica]
MNRALLIPFIAVSLASSVVFADTDSNADNWSGSAELGFVSTSGNSDTNNINGRLDLTQESIQWRTNYTLSSLYSSSDSDTTAEKYSGSIQSNYKFNTEEFWYVRGSHENDRFSGYRRKSSVSTGYGNRFWQAADGSYLEASAGVGYRDFAIERDTLNEDSDRGNFVRFAGTYEKRFTKTSLFRQELTSEISTNGGNTVNESVSSLQASLLENLAMKLAYRVKYTSDVPADTDTTDTETTASVLYSF